jgi:hypothetical protein
MPTLRPLLLPAASVLLLGAALATGTDLLRTDDAFRQLDEVLPTANVYRTSSGAPGHAYWQQRVDYVIDVALDEDARRITGSERITYHNHSPDALSYLWVQLDPNIFAPESHSVLTDVAPELDREKVEFGSLQRVLDRAAFDGRCEVLAVRDGAGEGLAHTINGTMMRVDLPAPLASGQRTELSIDWTYPINDSKRVRGRTGFELFDDGNAIFELAQWFPRLCAYTDYAGWQNKQFLGRGEFTLEFGDYEVRITVPDDHVVAATGVLVNPGEVLSPVQRRRLEEAKVAEHPVFVVTPEEARANESSTPSGTRTWVYRAEDVRDFAFASSRKFLWDAWQRWVGDRPVMAMSYWPMEGEPLWSRYSTQAVAHTLEVYSKFTFDYPYPVAISVNGPVGGMEYPMICFNGPRPEPDGTYSERTKYGLISVIIHEVGHNWFPMVVNSDERQWTWMDEGLNTFLQYLAEQEWEDDYPSWRGEPQKIVEYMSDPEQVPVMTNSESILQFGSNAYAKPATALNVLRETVMGRELFDFAFREYSRRWRFKRPTPADLFRSLEDASAVDLDWFWRGWFYTTDHVDLSIERVTRYDIDTLDPDVEKPLARVEEERRPVTLSQARNATLPKRVEDYPELLDFYNSYDEHAVTPADRRQFEESLAGLDERQRDLLATPLHFYVVELANGGGLVMPVILEVHYEDGAVEEHRIPAELWRKDARVAKRLIVTADVIAKIVLDPHLETADTDLSDNVFPREIGSERVRLEDEPEKPNPMQEEKAQDGG